MNIEEIKKQATEEAQQRVNQILSCPEAAGKFETAKLLAAEPSLSAEQAIAVLKTAALDMDTRPSRIDELIALNEALDRGRA